MTCREASDFLIDYVDGTLSGDLREIFERHLDACGNCRIYLATYRATIVASRSAMVGDSREPPAMPEDLVQAIVAALARERAG